MTKKTNINEILLHSVRMRIVQEIAANNEMTASEICEKINDVSRTTIYRHIKILLDNDILSVVSEKRIRGSIERTLAVNIQEISKHNTRENASQNAFGFLMNRYVRIHKYFNDENSRSTGDKIFWNSTVMMMDDTEFDHFLSDLRDLLVKYSFETKEGRKPRDISIISVPAESE